MEKPKGFCPVWLLEEVTANLKTLGFLPTPKSDAPFHHILRVEMSGGDVDVWVPKENKRSLILRQSLTLMQQEFRSLQPLEWEARISGNTRDIHGLLLLGIIHMNKTGRKLRETYKQLSETANVIERFSSRLYQRNTSLVETMAWIMNREDGTGLGRLDLTSYGTVNLTLNGLSREKTREVLLALYGPENERITPDEFLLGPL